MKLPLAKSAIDEARGAIESSERPDHLLPCSESTATAQKYATYSGAVVDWKHGTAPVVGKVVFTTTLSATAGLVGFSAIAGVGWLVPVAKLTNPDSSLAFVAVQTLETQTKVM